jgi:hypothetical protein
MEATSYLSDAVKMHHFVGMARRIVEAALAARRENG